VVSRALQAESLPRRLAALGLTFEQARPLIAPAPTAVEVLDPPPPSAEGPSQEERYLAATASAALLYIALAVYGSFVLNGVIEEKANRVVEVLLGALRPSDLLAGKVLGIVATAMLQLLAGLAGAIAALLTVGDAEIPRVAADVAVYSVIWFVLGLALYNFAYAAVGATVSRPSEAQNAAWPVTMLLLVPYAVSIVLVPNDPDGVVARVLSIVPLTAPLVMPSRVAVGEPATWEIALAFALMAPAILAMTWLAGRIYRATILRSGPRVRLLQALRSALRSS
jgi:ABC-2 type transport system permease protein